MMRGLARWSVENRVLVNVVMAVLIVGGLFSFTTIHREIFPLFALKLITVQTTYPGVAPAELEELVTIPVENAVAEVEGVDTIRSTTTEGLSVVIVELDDSIDDVNRVVQEAESAVDSIENFPVDADEPRVDDVDLDFPVIDVAIGGPASEESRRAVAKELKRQIETIAGVSSVEATGLRELEVWVEVDPDRIFQLGLSMDRVLNRLRQRLVDVPAGTLRTEQGEVLLRTSGTTTEPEEIESLIVRPSPDGRHIRLRDIGSARITFEEATTLARINGTRAIDLHVVKQKTGDTIEIVESIRELLDEERAGFPPGVEATTLNDGSVWIANRLRIMYQSGLWGLALVLLVLNLFLNPRVASMTAFGLPLAVAGGLIVLYVTGGSLNMLSLFAFILVIGILVDDAIVISENSYRYMQKGLDPEAAVEEGTSEIGIAVVAGVSTTIAAFLPLLMTEGVIGEFLKIVPVVAVATLAASLVEALIILPSHLADFCRPAEDAGGRRRTPAWFRRVRRGYSHLVCSALRNRYVTLGVLLVVTVAAIGMATTMKFVFFDESVMVEFNVDVTAPPGSALEDTEEIVEQVEEIALSFPTGEIRNAVSIVGRQPSENGPTEFGPHLGQVQVDLADFEVRSRPAQETFEEMRRRVHESVVGAENIEFHRETGGPPIGRAIYVRILGEDLDRLQSIAGEIESYILGIPGVHDIGDSFQPGKDEVRVEIDEDRASLYGLSVEGVGRMVRTAMDGTVVATLQEEDEEIDVRVRYVPERRRTLDDLTSLRIPAPGGGLVPFDNVASLERVPGPGNIDRESRTRVVAVFADVNDEVITSGEANAMIAREFADLSQRHPGYRMEFGGEAEETQESLTSLFQAFTVALLVIYAILGGIFKSFTQPLVVMFAIPFSLVGVVLGFWLIGEPLTFMVLFGVIALAGVVVNDSLLLVHFVNQARRRGTPVIRAVAISSKRRFRPVLLTTMTTIAGVLPLALARSGQAAFLAPMALAIVFGLAFSTTLILILVPSLYLINHDLIGALQRWLAGSSGKPTRVAEEHSAPPSS